jgi:tetratricopeptide (TPR) repeat protein
MPALRRTRFSTALAAGLLFGLLQAPLHPQTGSGSSFAVVVGVSEHDDMQMAKTPGAADAANRMTALFKDPRCGLRNVVTLINKDADSSSIELEIRKTLRKAAAEDTVYIFMAGPVLNDSGAAFFMAYDSTSGAKRSTAYPLAELRKSVESSKCQNIVIFLDGVGQADGTELKGLAEAKNVILGAVGASPSLAFSRALAEALEGSLSTDRTITGSELAAVFNKTPRSVFSASRLRNADQVLLATNRPLRTPPTPPEPVPTSSAKSPNPPAPPKVDPRVAESKEWLRKGQAYLQAQHWSDAIDCFTKARQIDPSLEVAKTGLKDALLGSAAQANSEHKWDDALADLKSAEGLGAMPARYQSLVKQASLGLRLQQGTSAIQSGKWDAAVAAFQAARQLDQQNQIAADGILQAQIHLGYDRGLAALKKGDVNGAVVEFASIEKDEAGIQDARIRRELAPLLNDGKERLEEAGTEVLVRLGMEKFNHGDFKQAEALFLQALAKQPGNSAALAGVKKLGQQDQLDNINKIVAAGQKKLDAHDWDGAVTEFKRAQELNDSDTRARDGVQRANQAMAARKRTWSIALAGAGVPTLTLVAIFASPFRRARFYGRMGWNKRAARVYKRLLDRNPSRDDALKRLVYLNRMSGKRDSAVQLCTRYLRVKPDHAGIIRLLGELHFEMRANAEALECYRRLVAAGHGDGQVYQRILALQDLASPSNGENIAMYEQALRNSPESPELNLLVSRLYMRQGRSDPEALAVYRRTLASDGTALPLRLASARGYFEQGRFNDAAAEAREVLRIDPTNQSALAVMLRAHRSSDSLGDALAFMESAGTPPLLALTAAEDLLQEDPSFRPALARLYEYGAHADGDLFANRLHAVHLAMDRGANSEALDLLTGLVRDDSKAASAARELIRVCRRFLTSHPPDSPEVAELLFQVGELERAEGDWRSALGAFEATVALPEWKLRSSKAMEEILDSLPLRDLGASFFERAGWKIQPALTGPADLPDLVVTPTVPFESTLYSFFEDSAVRCLERPVSLDDIVQLRHYLLLSQTPVNRSFSFVLSPIRPRQDVFAVIYALITEEEPLRIIPLEAAPLKQAIIDLRCRDTLDQLLRLWVGQGDLFDVHSPIADASTFFGRGQYLHRLTSKINRAENFAVFGLRKVGKTSLIFQLRENLSRILVAYVDLQSIASRRCDEVYFRLASALKGELRVKYPEAPPLTSCLLDYDPRRTYPTVASDFHSDLLKIRELMESNGTPARVLLLLDEIELLVPQGQTAGFVGYDDFLRQIRGLFQQERFVLSSVVGADPTVCRTGKWGDRDNPVFQYYDEVFLMPLERAECDEMVQGIGEVMGISFDEASLYSIYEESGGHPYVARQLCSRIISRFQARPLQVTSNMVEEGVDDYVAQRPDYFVGIFRGYVSSDARRILEVAAASQENEVSRQELLSLSGKTGLDFTALEKALQDLEVFNLMTRDKDRYQIKIRLLRRWIRRSWLGIE